jgi:hypothetical protein
MTRGADRMLRIFDPGAVASARTDAPCSPPLLPLSLLFSSMTDSSLTPAAATSSSPASSQSDARIFNRWRKTFGVITGLGLSDEERAVEMQAHHIRTCEQWKRQLMNYSQHSSVLRWPIVLAEL